MPKAKSLSSSEPRARMTVAPPALGVLDGGVEQRALADARVTFDEQQMPAPGSCRVEQLGDRVQLVLAFEEHVRTRTRDDHW